MATLTIGLSPEELAQLPQGPQGPVGLQGLQGLQGDSGLFVPNVFNVKDYGAVGNGVANETAAIQFVFEAIRLAGGGIAFFPLGNYRVATAGNNLCALTLGASNVMLQGQGPGSRLFSELTSQGVIAIQGSAKATGSYPKQASGQYQRQTVYPFALPLAGASSITLTTIADAARFAVGDYIYIRTGQANGNASHDEPTAEMNRVKGITGAVISLAWPLVRAYAQEYFQAGSATTLAADAIAGITTITVTSAAGYVPGDYITIKGAAGQADHQSVVQSVAGNNVTMYQAPDKTIPAAGSIVHKSVGGGGLTTTNVSAYPAAFGVCPVTATTIENISIRDMKIENTYSGVTAIRLDQVVNFDMTNCVVTTRRGAILGNKHCFVRIYNNRFDLKPVTNEQAFVLGSGSGSGYVSFIGNHLSSEGFGGVTLSEATAHGSIINNVFMLNGSGPTDYAINIQTRSGPTTITGNHVTNSGAAAPIFADISTLGGIIDGNTLRGSGGMNIQGDNWHIGSSNKMLTGAIKLQDPDREPGAVTSPQFLSAWVTSSNLTAVLGVLPVNTIVTAAWLDVLVAFNGTGSKDVKVGVQGGIIDQYVKTGILPSDWGVVGPKVPTLGENAGHYNSVQRIMQAAYQGVGATQGKALIVVEYRIVPVSP